MVGWLMIWGVVVFFKGVVVSKEGRLRVWGLVDVGVVSLVARKVFSGGGGGGNSYMCVYKHNYLFIYVCVRVSVALPLMYIYIYIVCVCVCMDVSE